MDVARLGAEYVDFARAKGLATRVILLRHVLRNALISTLALLGPTVGTLLGGAVITESVFAIPGVDEGANTSEFFLHHEDVRRAGVVPHEPRELGEDVEEWMWRRLKLLARAHFRRASLGVVLERTDVPAPSGEPETIRAASGTPIVTALGRPSELTLLANGRTGAADVRYVGEPEAVDTLLHTDLSV